ncbi:hypothetical protein ACJ8BV_01995 [Klebsiella pneumoniae]
MIDGDEPGRQRRWQRLPQRADALAAGQLAQTFTTGEDRRGVLAGIKLQRHHADKGQQQRDHRAGKSRTTDEKGQHRLLTSQFIKSTAAASRSRCAPSAITCSPACSPFSTANC